MAHVTVMTGPERRRRWGSDERREILMAAFSPGAIVADVARRYEVATSLIYKWRREVRAARDEAGFIPAVMIDDHAGRDQACRSEPAIIVELARGARVTISAGAPASIVSATLRALR
jgi:transposase